MPHFVDQREQQVGGHELHKILSLLMGELPESRGIFDDACGFIHAQLKLFGPRSGYTSKVLVRLAEGIAA